MVELLLLAPEESVEAVSDALIDECGALAVSVEDADAGTVDEHALYGEPGLPVSSGAWQRSAVKALFADAEQATQAATLLLAGTSAAHVRLLRQQPVEDRDWVRVTQSQFAPVEITPAFWIVPSWHEPPPGALRMIRLDPGMAFGTGTHPTTRMCLRWIAADAQGATGPHRRVLDYGCGSGILAIAAALHGSITVDAVDIDPAAVEATRGNADHNGVELRTGLPDFASGRYDLVLANILATPLKLLAPLICNHLASDGALVLAGILERQADELKVSYAPWLRLDVADIEDGWILMTGRMA